MRPLISSKERKKERGGRKKERKEILQSLATSRHVNGGEWVNLDLTNLGFYLEG